MVAAAAQRDRPDDQRRPPRRRSRCRGAPRPVSTALSVSSSGRRSGGTSPRVISASDSAVEVAVEPEPAVDRQRVGAGVGDPARPRRGAGSRRRPGASRRGRCAGRARGSCPRRSSGSGRRRSGGRTARAGSGCGCPAGWCCAPTTAITRPPRRTGIASTRTGTSSRHSGSPSRTSRPGRRTRCRAGGRRPAGTKVPTTSSTYAVGPVVGRIWAPAQKPALLAVRQPQHQVGEGQVGDDLPVGQEQVQPGHVLVVEVRVDTDELGQGRHAGQRNDQRPVAGTAPTTAWAPVRVLAGWPPWSRRTGSRWRLPITVSRPIVASTTSPPSSPRMLGSTDPDLRDGVAYPMLATWIERGVYDDLLAGLGDGMAAGLTIGLGQNGTDTVFRRSFSALILAECIDRDNRAALVPPTKVLEWGDRVTTWFVRERDTRGFVPGQGLGARRRARRRRPGLPGPVPALLDPRADGAPRRDRRPAAAARRRGLHRRRARPAGRGDDDGAAPQPGAARRRRALGGPPDGDRGRRAAASPPTRSCGAATPRRSCARCTSSCCCRPTPPEIRSDLLLVLGDALRAANPAYLKANR